MADRQFWLFNGIDGMRAGDVHADYGVATDSAETRTGGFVVAHLNRSRAYGRARAFTVRRTSMEGCVPCGGEGRRNNERARCS
jgi:hypothetical protein